MIEIKLRVDGMMCGMCEAHVNDAVRRAFPEVKKVRSNHRAGETVILTVEDLSAERLSEEIAKTGYRVVSVEKKEVEKRGLFW